MQTLANGTLCPEDGDLGSQFWDALVALATAFDALIGVTTQAVTSSGWSASGVWYRKTITMPGDFEFGQCTVQAFLNATGHPFFPKMEKINATSFYLYMPVDNLAVDLLYTRI